MHGLRVLPLAGVLAPHPLCRRLPQAAGPAGPVHPLSSADTNGGGSQTLEVLVFDIEQTVLTALQPFGPVRLRTCRETAPPPRGIVAQAAASPFGAAASTDRLHDAFAMFAASSGLLPARAQVVVVAALVSTEWGRRVEGALGPAQTQLRRLHARTGVLEDAADVRAGRRPGRRREHDETDDDRREQYRAPDRWLPPDRLGQARYVRVSPLEGGL